MDTAHQARRGLRSILMAMTKKVYTYYLSDLQKGVFMRLFPRSKKKRVIKKWFKRTGYLKVLKVDLYVDVGKGLYMYRLPKWAMCFEGEMRVIPET